MTVELIARCVRGIEYVVADEVAALRPHRLELGARAVRFRLPGPTPAVGALRTADDVFLAVGSVTEVGHRKDVVPWLAGQAAELDWPAAAALVRQVRALPPAPWFDVVASLTGRRNYSRYDVEDAVGAALSAALGARYASRRNAVTASMPPVALSVRVLISGDSAELALRLGDRPLHRRPYKEDAARGTLHPPVAAALARLAAVGPGDRVLDPFCGDGTIVIEAAERAPGSDLRGSDLDPVRVKNATANAARAGAAVTFAVMDAGRLELGEESVDALVTNPPWNLAVDAAGALRHGLGGFWPQAARVLSPAGRLGLIADAELGVPGDLRRLGYRLSLVQTVRLAGRLSEIVLCTPPGRSPRALPAGIAQWRDAALAAGLAS